MWAFGVSLYAYMFGEMPFLGVTEDTLTTEIENKVLNYDGKEVSEGFKEMMYALLDKNPD